MKRIALIFIIFISFILSVSAETSTEKVKFVKCVDGDTAVFSVNNDEVKFRFLAIDTPETVHPTKEVEKYGKDASEYTCNKLTNANEIIVEYENSNKTDKYGRSLAWIWADGVLIQKELVSVGYAKVAYIYGNYRYTKSLCFIQSNAKSEKLGIWNDSNDDGYCSTVDLTDVTDNISYDNINKPVSEEDEIVKKLDTIDNKLTGFFDKHEDTIDKAIFYTIIGCAIISVIIREIKRK